MTNLDITQIARTEVQDFIVSTVKYFDYYQTIVFDKQGEQLEEFNNKSKEFALVEHFGLVTHYLNLAERKEPQLFEVGKTYTAKSITDSNCLFTIEVVKRTAKTITVIEDGKQRTFKVKFDEDDNCEYVKDGSYSLAPTYKANRGA